MENNFESIAKTEWITQNKRLLIIGSLALLLCITSAWLGIAASNDLITTYNYLHTL